MRHVEKALVNLVNSDSTLDYAKFITIDNAEDVKGIAPVVRFEIQSDPIGEVGVNGVQATDIIKYAKFLIESLNDAFPCIENELTISALNTAISIQKLRTRDRERRSVEGENKL